VIYKHPVVAVAVLLLGETVGQAEVLHKVWIAMLVALQSSQPKDFLADQLLVLAMGILAVVGVVRVAQAQTAAQTQRLVLAAQA
jgi:hypothetical protein